MVLPLHFSLLNVSGVRQGCPISGILFVIGVELLASAIRSDKSIKGLSLDSKEFRLSEYADDTTCLVQDTSSASNLFEKLDLFRLCSGLELNRSKTEALWLGSNKNRTDTPFGIRWPEGSMSMHLAYALLQTTIFLIVKT